MANPANNYYPLNIMANLSPDERLDKAVFAILFDGTARGHDLSKLFNDAICKANNSDEKKAIRASFIDHYNSH
jgi:hypothetical protein